MRVLRPPRRALAALPLAGAATAVALLSTACTVAPYAAVVNGTVISQSTLVAQAKALAAGNATASGVGAPTTLAGTLNPQTFSSILSLDIQATLVTQLLAKHHVTVTSEATSAAQAYISGVAALARRASQAGSSSAGSVPPSLVPAFVRLQAGAFALEAALSHAQFSTAALQTFYNQHGSQLGQTQVCLLDAVFATQDQAQRVVDAMNGGSSLADAVNAVAPGTKATSDPNHPDCTASLGQIAQSVPEVAQSIETTPPGTPGGPIHIPPTSQSPDSYLVFVVVSLTPPPFSFVIGTVANALYAPGARQFSAEFTAASKNARVTVNPADGTYSTATSAVGPGASGTPFAITPPVAPDPSFLPSWSTSTTALPAPGPQPGATGGSTVPSGQPSG